MLHHKWSKERTAMNLFWLISGAAESFSTLCYADVYPSKILKHLSFIKKSFLDSISFQNCFQRRQRIYWRTFWQLILESDIEYRIFVSIGGGNWLQWRTTSLTGLLWDIIGFPSNRKFWTKRWNWNSIEISPESVLKQTDTTTKRQPIIFSWRNLFEEAESATLLSEARTSIRFLSNHLRESSHHVFLF